MELEKSNRSSGYCGINGFICFDNRHSSKLLFQVSTCQPQLTTTCQINCWLVDLLLRFLEKCFMLFLVSVVVASAVVQH